MARGQNRFKDEQWEVLASLYGEDASTYKDMQAADYLLKKIGYNDNPERAILLLNLVLRFVIIPFYDDNPEADLSFEITEKMFNMKSISKEIQQQKVAEIIENVHHRFHKNELRMTEIGKKLVSMADALNAEKLNNGTNFTFLKTNKFP